MKTQEKKGNNEQMQNINKDQLATSLNEKETEASETMQIGTTQQEKPSFDAMDNTQEHSNYAEQKTEDNSNIQPNGLVKGKAKTILPDYAPSVEYLKSKMRGEDGKFRMLPSADIELWIKAVYNSGEIDENKWELIKLLNKMHIFSLADEYEKENKLKEEADKNWLAPKGENTLTQGFGDLKMVEIENEQKEINNYEPPTMYFGNGTIKTGDTVIQDPPAPIKKDDSKIQSINYDKVQVDDGTLGKKEDQSVVNTSTNQQGFGAFKSVENYSSEKKDDTNALKTDYSFWNNYAKEIYEQTSVDDGLTVSERIDMLLRNFPDEFFAQTLSERGQPNTKENIDKIKTAVREQMTFDSRGNDAIIISGSVGASLKLSKKTGLGAGFGGGIIYSPMLDESFPMIESSGGFTGSKTFSGQILGLRIIELENNEKNEITKKANSIKNAHVLRKVLSGVSVGAIVSYGASFGVIIPKEDNLNKRFIILVVGLGTSQIGGLGISNSETIKDYIKRRTQDPETQII